MTTAAAMIGELLALLPEAERDLLERVCRADDTGLPDAGQPLSLSLARCLPGTVRVNRATGQLTIPSPQQKALLLSVFDGNSAEGVEIRDLPAVLTTIRAFQAVGEYEEAAALFRKVGGFYFIHLYGLDICLEILNGFPPEMVTENEVLIAASAMHALKSGNISRAQHMMGERFGSGFLSLETGTFSKAFPASLRVFRFVMAIYEDAPISQQMRQRLFALLGELAVDDHLHRGGFYNAMLTCAIDRHELALAEELANRAQHHYRLAEAHLLVFYVELHRSLVALQRGRMRDASSALTGARAALERVTFETPADWRLLTMIEAIIAFEDGDTSALLRFINEEFDQFAYGEIWPSIVEPALAAGSQLLLEQIGLGAALTFLDRWRVQEWRSRRFNLAITMREVDVLQRARRWQNAADRMMSVQSRINLTWIESAEEALTRLVDPMEIDLAMGWLRHLIEQVPNRPLLRDQIAALLRNDNVGERNRGRLQLWAAYLARLDRDISTARRQLANVLESVAQLGIHAHLLGDAGLFETLIGDKRIASHVMSSSERRTAARQLKARLSGGDAERTPLTRQELRVLRLVAEGGTNKFVARQMRISEVTVKFHLSNAYRKMGCRRRGEAIAAARALGWVS
ncbi:helix-turn-helix transcriptional regulator [Stappia sp. ICDLI1TA098]